ncbi:hypothetical protein PFICI_12570 [Pestalotiopsis fici W106-1]|uniref:C2H2-type domain-containing protein n=1 Tax=Pestalotiopsis fici (strain W106-1 / CGMCC3.15140) TaxID=1229662 RepID=W3WS21_PESFW|nr:uncharacterized protein PFICI_12570 [Pestalotiopsis fici W106-1]ETS75626.1 hypothetical protein PFICI_12570 [Pestalotiopsis fici W106-1]
MLSNPPQSGLPPRGRHHKRQYSTPSAFETMKIAPSNLPNQMHPQQQQMHHLQQQPQQPGSTPEGSRPRQRILHRRGLSMDIRQQQRQLQSPAIRQEFHNTHVLREAQQQRLARPGSQQAFTNLATDENYLISPHTTPHLNGFEGQCFDGLQAPQNMNMFSTNIFTDSMGSMMKKNQETYSDNMTASQDFDLYPTSTMSTPTFITSFSDSPGGPDPWTSEGESPHARRSSRRVSNGIMDRVVKFETLHVEDPQRPITPPHQNANDYFPISPRGTSHGGTIKHPRQPQRFMDDYDESMEETLKPNRHSGNRPMTTFEAMRQAAEGPASMPESRRSSIAQMSTGAYEPPVPNPFMQVPTGMTISTQLDGLPVPPHPMSASSNFSQHASPMTPSMASFAGGPFDLKPELRPHMLTQDALSVNESQSTEKASRRNSPHRRTDSIASIASAASIASLDIEQTRTTTGITIEDIHQYIEGPEPSDNKWVCTYDGCNKRFGRKENIKSHVQTHLNDRQYQCPHCQKCFVRQHDLKRHAKIHTGVKPYPCECGNSFARHDALTRHRQRGMCVGAFDGVVRKTVKRGRPRKQRPDVDERQEKSERTRRRNRSTAGSISSQSGYSDSSAANSPEPLDPDFSDALDDIMDISMGGTTIRPSSLQAMSSSAPMPSLSATVATSSAHSPSATSIHSYVSQLSHMSLHADPLSETMPTRPGSPAKSVASHYNEVPELSQSSSPPVRYFDVDPSNSQTEPLITTASENVNISALSGIDDADDDLLLQFTTGDLSMMNMKQFEDGFSSADMYPDGSNPDVFFGAAL